ncbi:PhzF family phenazine biosynthesis protein [Legionella hackeliae]|uniref:Phenazine biosynthesis protein, PhzC/F family n=1 Tax=Legionella hackeliae TaxID=449 RepID=A0A0A8UT44_LEGHA|nr:PhzF family phenazine biosynthesis protein [Legionella hackeliae]KTD13947.1 phenazine biosynthesis PhzF [Legionella hackeliae]CEK10651.1 phenazine biosynthesis protein, PhzC/F family [Legionella hackeliae]STX47397.1 phenazine biosynthesis PhzF [Legionella hackeliae]
MANIEIFQIDAFTDKIFHGNPAAVCILNEWLNDELMQAIAVENNLSETAFVIEDKHGFHIRWFTPRGEISLCGHATLAAGFVLHELEKCPGNSVNFSSKSGPLAVKQKGERYTLDFPRLDYQLIKTPEIITALVDKPCIETYESELDYMILLAAEDNVLQAQVDIKALSKLPKRGLILTSGSSEADFYSRCFYPKHNIPEDPVTGSAHCVLAPFWANRLNKNTLKAVQGSIRKGEILCEVLQERVYLSGYCKWYSRGHLVI